jgi:hypothetical protein
MAGVALGSVLLTGAAIAASHEYTTGEKTVVVGEKPGTVADQVCNAAGELVGDAGFNRDACEEDLGGFALPDGTKISVRKTFQPVGPGGLMVPNIRTDLDPLQKKNQ